MSDKSAENIKYCIAACQLMILIWQTCMMPWKKITFKDIFIFITLFMIWINKLKKQKDNGDVGFNSNIIYWS